LFVFVELVARLVAGFACVCCALLVWKSCEATFTSHKKRANVQASKQTNK
jgi:hypothetical protein